MAALDSSVEVTRLLDEWAAVEYEGGSPVSALIR